MLGRYEMFLAGLRRPLTEARPWPADPVRPRRLREVARETHRFVQRSAACLAGAGISQFIVVGPAQRPSCPLRTAVLRVQPWARVASLSSDALGVAARHRLLSGEPWSAHPRWGAAPFAAAAPTPADLIRVAAAAGLDLDRPVALYLLGALHHILDDRAAGRLVGRLAGALPQGSHLVISQLAGEFPSASLDAAVRAYRRVGQPVRLRTRQEVGALLSGLDLLAPGIAAVSEWRRDPDDVAAPPASDVPCWGAVGRIT